MKIVMLAGNSISTDLVYRGLSRKYKIEKIIVENRNLQSKVNLIKRRIKKLGLKKVIGQLMFQLMYVPKLKRKSKDRIRNIIYANRLEGESPRLDAKNCIFVDSVNSRETIDALQKIDPDVVIVQGTSIIKKEVLNCCKAKFINMHSGITPKYRGVHGGYWALVQNDREHCGVTVHLVDEGIDTGGIIYQGKIEPTEEDNFATYPYLQYVKGIELELAALKDIEEDRLSTRSNDLESRLWSHPTLCEYMRNKVK